MKGRLACVNPAGCSAVALRGLLSAVAGQRMYESLTHVLLGSYDQSMKRGMVIAWNVVLCGCLTAAAQDQPRQAPAPRQYSQGVLITVEGAILPQLERYVNRKLDESQQLGADLVILEIDSPGGAVDVTLNLAARVTELSWRTRSLIFPTKP